MTFPLFALAAALEIGGCYLVWLAVKQAQPWLWLPALLSLAGFAWVLAVTGMDSAGRAFAIYGGIYILGSIVFMATIEGVRPDRWDMIGVTLALAGAGVIFFAPRG